MKGFLVHTPAVYSQKSGSETIFCQIKAAEGWGSHAGTCSVVCRLSPVYFNEEEVTFLFLTPAIEFKHCNYFSSNTRCYTHYMQFWRLSYHCSLQYMSVCNVKME